MSTNVTGEFHKSAATYSIPADHVLNSGAVTFHGAFDQQGCPLVVFPVERQSKLVTDLKKEEVVEFVNYFLRLHNKFQDKESLVSVVVDLRKATLTITRFIAETVLLLELHKRTVHTVYAVQPKKKDVLKLLLKFLIPSHAKNGNFVPFKHVFLKEVFELCSYIDRSQLTADLGGYLVYCHQSWVTFLKEIDGFVQEFLSVVHRLPSCIATLQTLSCQAIPSTLEEVEEFCCLREAMFQELRRELGLEELLGHCERVLEKLRYPENEPCYRDMAGTALFTHTAYDMLQNYNRITSAVEKVELLWQQASSKAQLQLQVLRLQREAHQLIGLINQMRQEKLQPYRIEMAKDAKKAEGLKMQFESSIYTPAMALVRRADDVIHTLAERVPPAEVQAQAEWVGELDHIKERFCAAVELPYQTLRMVSDFYCYYNKCKIWYEAVLCEKFLQDLLWSGKHDNIPKLRYAWDVRGKGTPPWKQEISNFLRKNPSPELEVLVQLAHLSNVISDPQLQHSGNRLSQRCMTLRKLLTSLNSVPLNDLQMALQWQYEFLRANERNAVHVDTARAKPYGKGNNWAKSKCFAEKHLKSSMSDLNSRQNSVGFRVLSNFEQVSEKEVKRSHHKTLTEVTQGILHPSVKPPSLSSYDSGFDGAGSTYVDTGAGREGWSGRVAMRAKAKQPQIHEENVSSVPDSEECNEIDVGDGSNTSIESIPKIMVNSLNFELKVKRSAKLPRNPWLSLPVEDLEKSYTVTIVPDVQDVQRESTGLSELSYQSHTTKSQGWSIDPEMHARSLMSSAGEGQLSSIGAGGTQMEIGIQQAQDSFEESELSPINNVLSSTITDTQEKVDISESHPTLLWDTYDFHNTKQDGSERSLIELSLSDWDIKEQKGLEEVEEILDRAAEIIEEEENVLAQEEMLDALLKSDDPCKQWPLWGANNLTRTSSKELMEAGVGFEDCPCSDGSDQHAEPVPWSCVRMPCDAKNDDNDRMSNQSGKCDLFQELRDLNILEQRIMEENLKIHELRQSEETATLSEQQLDPRGAWSLSKDRQLFRKELEKEKQEVEEMEMSLKETVKNQLKKRLHRGRKVAKCSTVERNSRLKVPKDTDVCQGVVSSCMREPQEQFLKPTDITAEFGDVNAKTISNHNHPNDLQVPLDKVEEAPVNCEVGKNVPACDSVVCDRVDSSGPLNKTSSVCILLEKDGRLDQGPLTCLSNAPEDEEYSVRGVTCVKSQSMRKDKDQVVDGLMFLDQEVCVTAASLKHGEFDHSDDASNPPMPKPRKMCKDKQSSAISEEESVENNATELTQEFVCPPKPKERTSKRFTQVQLAKVSPGIISSNNNNNNNKELLVTCEHMTRCVDADSAAVQGEGLSSGAPGKYCSDPEEPEANTACSNLNCVENGLKSNLLCTEGEFTNTSHEVVVDSDGPSAATDQLGSLSGDDGSMRAIYGSPFNVSHHCVNAREVSDFGVPLVLDTGSGLTKAGFADQDLPTTIFPTVIGFPKYEEVMSGAPEHKMYIGHEAQHMRGVLTLKYPMKHGVVRNWDDMEKIWHHAFQQLCVEPTDHPVLLTEAAMNPHENRRRMLELMFEAFGVPYAYVAMQAALALYSAGRTTGVVFDSGDGVSHSVPVFEGYCLPHAVQRFSLAGADVTLHLRKLLLEQGVVMRTSAELEIVREMKEQCCCVSQDYEAQLSCDGGSISSRACYTMPDGLVVQLGTERFRAPEILFKPELIGGDHYGVHESVFRSILQCDIDLRRSFLGNIVLSGGNTLLAGLPQRLQSEIRNMVPVDLGESVRVTSPQDRDFSVWVGGATLASLPSSVTAWISQEEYEEFGPQIIFRKCF